MQLHRSAPHDHRRESRRQVVVASLVGTAVVAAALAVGPTAPAAAAESLLSQGKNTSASSSQGNDTPASGATDGNLGTRWSSKFTDNEWLQVNLGASSPISKVVLRWEGAYGKNYKIQTSDNLTTWTTIKDVVNGPGGVETFTVAGRGQYVRMLGTLRSSGFGFSLWEFQVYGEAVATPPPTGTFNPNLDPGESITVTSQGITPSYANPPTQDVTHREFQANCIRTHAANDDPIVAPGVVGGSHSHTFVGSPTVNARTTTGSLLAGGTSCTVPGDRSGYWFPTMFNGTTEVKPVGEQTIYYKSGIIDYKSVRPFPRGIRFVVGSPTQTQAEFQAHPGTVEGWECGNAVHMYNVPAFCDNGSQFNVRFQAPSCWDGRNLDVADHRSHMAYPVGGRCTTNHPVAVPMLEFKIAFPVSGNMSQVRLASGPVFTWHYDFFNGWDPAVQNALVKHCINGGLQCSPRGYDQYKPSRGYALDEQFRPLVF